MIKQLKRFYKAKYIGFKKKFLVNGRLPFASNNNGFLILNYHNIQKNSDYSFAISQEDFEFQLRYLVNNFRIKTVAEIVEHISTGKSAPDILVGITFDDGCIDNYKYAIPLLQKYNIPALFFINPYIIDLQYKSFMSWDEVFETADTDLIQFGSHGLCHLPLPVLSREDIELEISKSKTLLEEKLKKEVTYFAYPFGMVHPACEEFLKRCGYQAAFTTCLNTNKIINPYSIGRLVITDYNSVANYFENAVACAIRYYQDRVYK